MKINHFIQNGLSSDFATTIEEKVLELAKLSEINEEHAAALSDHILDYYTQGLSYHNLSHIYTFLQIADCLKSEIQQPLAFYWAILFHDAIYNPRKKDNESKSAQLATRELERWLKPNDLSQVDSLILSTAKHFPLKEKDSDHLLFLDIDLSILASDPTIYKQYALAVRKEYKHVPGFLYRYARKKVLKSFLERSTIFYTKTFQKWGGTKARTNIQNEIKAM